ncbi:MAG: hypothetical protein HRU25_16430, partial [Psychrobium sp.]|nr:hypothetical protein [Psychrobium sp.]
IVGGDTDKALQYAQLIKAIDPVNGIEKIADIYQKLEKADLALQTLDQGIISYPKSSELHLARALNRFDDEAWPQIRTDLKQALQFSQQDARGNILYLIGKVSALSSAHSTDGVDALNEALTISNKNYIPWIHLRLAQIYVNAKNLNAANTHLAMIKSKDNDALEEQIKLLTKKMTQHK